jgi:hypothetical protein
MIHALGFQAMSEDDPIVARFTSITVFEARGITLGVGVVNVARGDVDGTEYGIALAESLNDACMALSRDQYTDVESQWRAEHNCAGPFLLIAVGPTSEFVSCDGWFKTEQDGSVTTLDSFPGLRADLARREGQVLPRVVSALTCAFNEEGQYVALHELDRGSSGRTRDGVVVHDIHIKSQGDGYVSHPLAEHCIKDKLTESMRRAKALNPKSSKLFALGVGEKEEYKKFMYFFLALEVETHLAFGRIDHAGSVDSMLDASPMKRQFTMGLLKRQAEQLRSLGDRFIWCATFVWTNLLDEDVDQFKKLKDVRDGIAHGRLPEPPAGFSLIAEKLAQKIMLKSR